jgi:inorganic triphosphatase YgiF
VRRIGDRYVQTIKATGNGRLLERNEWESDIGGEMPDLDLARGTALEPLLNESSVGRSIRCSRRVCDAPLIR